AQHLAQSDDRIRELVVGDERAARRVRDVEPTHESLAKHPDTNDADVALFREVALRTPAGGGLDFGPTRRLEKMRTAGLVHQPVPALRLFVSGWPGPPRANPRPAV